MDQDGIGLLQFTTAIIACFDIYYVYFWILFIIKIFINQNLVMKCIFMPKLYGFVVLTISWHPLALIVYGVVVYIVLKVWILIYLLSITLISQLPLFYCYLSICLVPLHQNWSSLKIQSVKYGVANRPISIRTTLNVLENIFICLVNGWMFSSPLTCRNMALINSLINFNRCSILQIKIISFHNFVDRKLLLNKFASNYPYLFIC